MTKKITLSFDNGPDPEVTPEVLEILEEKDVKTSFFVVGDKLRDPERRAIVESAHSRGHWIGNHTFNHLVPLGLSRYDAATTFEIGRTQELIGDLSHEMKWFRPFGGGGIINTDLLDKNAYEFLQEGQFTCVLWNIVPRDWEIPTKWVDVALDMCRRESHPLVVIHDITTGAMNHLGEFIDRAREEGMSFVQEFPDDCLPMVKGKTVIDMAPFIATTETRETAAGKEA